MANASMSRENDQEVIGLIPAGGIASRLLPIPCSKEIYPIGFGPLLKDGNPHPKVVCHYLLEKFRLAGISKAYLILRSGKWDIPAYLGDGKMLNMHFAYLIMDLPFGVPYTLDQAYPFVKNAIVALGMPDIIFQPEDAFLRLLERQADTNADIVLGLIPVEKPYKWDMVDLDEKRRIRCIVIKPPRTHLPYAWVIAVWTPVFTDFMHEQLVTRQQEIENRDNAGNSLSKQRELYLGDLFQAAIQHKLQVDTLLFTDGNCLDIGTSEDMVKAIQSAI